MILYMQITNIKYKKYRRNLQNDIYESEVTKGKCNMANNEILGKVKYKCEFDINGQDIGKIKVLDFDEFGYNVVKLS